MLKKIPITLTKQVCFCMDSVSLIKILARSSLFNLITKNLITKNHICYPLNGTNTFTFLCMDSTIFCELPLWVMEYDQHRIGDNNLASIQNIPYIGVEFVSSRPSCHEVDPLKGTRTARTWVCLNTTSFEPSSSPTNVEAK